MDTLIIEDDLTTRTILEKWMTGFGNCHASSNGEDGVEAFDIALKSGYPYDLVCLDINMPGIDGHETLKRIRALEESVGVEPGQGTKVLMVTANEDSKNVMQAFKSQCDGYLVKPLSKVKLMLELKKLNLDLPLS